MSDNVAQRKTGEQMEVMADAIDDGLARDGAIEKRERSESRRFRSVSGMRAARLRKWICLSSMTAIFDCHLSCPLSPEFDTHHPCPLFAGQHIRTHVGSMQ